MKTQLQYNNIMKYVQITAFVALVLFIFLWENHTYINSNLELQRQAHVLAIDLWNIDPVGTITYMELAARLSNYQHLTVFSESGEIFSQISGVIPDAVDRFFIKLGLIPKIALISDITYKNQVVGKMEAIRLHDTIYIYCYVIIVIILIILVTKFFLNTLQAKDSLDQRVKERTEELRIVNEKLKIEEERYREIFNAPSDAFFLHDAVTGKILDVNKGMVELTGYSHEEALKLDMSDLSSGIFPYIAEEAHKKIQKAVQEGPQVFEWQSKKKDGTVFWSEVSLKYTEFGEQRFVIAVARDIDKRKETEQSLAEEKERLSVTLRSIGDGVITTDTDGRIILMNRVAETLTGWSQTEAMFRPSSEIFNIINEKTLEKCADPVKLILSSGNSISLESSTVLLSKNGSRRNIADSGAPIRDKESRVVGAVLVFRDVTQSLKMEAELLKGKKLESIAILAGGIAHDFNNILSAILGNMDLALLDDNLKIETRDRLIAASKASIRAKSLTQQLLTFSKGGEPVKETSSITEIIKESAEFNLHGSSIVCQYHFPDKLDLVEVDKGQISQVIQNLVINAKNAMPDGGVLRISCENLLLDENHPFMVPENEHYIKISLQDNGIGISPEILDKIFDPFFSTKQEGSGLGLAICHSIITKHKGQITVESTLGKGTTMNIWLPVSPHSRKNETSNHDHHDSNSRLRILVMDDEEAVLDIAQSMLEAIGHTVIVAHNGNEAVQLYKQHWEEGSGIDLVIMDLTIPGGMGGKEAVKGILEIDTSAKVIVSSGYSNDPIMANCKEYGFCDTITKPYQLKDLAVIINRITA